ncbi:alpha/beta hydrolase [Actinomadura terrae]|uniref:alpha/beta hydrolase n=1 Tax=Actinomadura terrae TaxID=604353 RepID=UPI001FA7D625|nr:alpha/beta hydrolase [Actinomadura terrae]
MASITSIPGKVVVFAAILTAFGLVPGAASPSERAARWIGRKPPERLVWKRCTGLPGPEPGVKQPPGGFRCTTLQVPLDHDEPSGETIGIALIRVPATDAAHRIGSLLFNFGGPGGEGVDTLAQAAGDYARLNARYDLVGFDPRGVGRSAPVTCVDDRRMDVLTAAEGTPDTPAEEAAFAADEASYNKGCEARSRALLPHVGTVSAARDMDLVRAALGDSRLHYFGISYGTWLGGSYAHRHPDSVGRAVLDGAVDTAVDPAGQALAQAAAFQRALGAFGTACAALGRRACPLGGDGPGVAASVQRLLTGLDRTPLPARGGRKLTERLATSGVTTALYSRQAWPILAQGLVDAATRRDGTLLRALADAGNGRRADGSYTNLSAANTAIACADTTARYTPADVRRLLPGFRAASPVFGAALAWGLLQCAGWPVAGDEAAREVSAPSAAPILVVGNTGDPATPYAWAPALTKALGGRATLLTLRGEGHGAYDTGDPCVRRTVDAYLLQGTVPPAGTVCPPIKYPAGPAGPKDLTGRPGPPSSAL